MGMFFSRCLSGRAIISILTRLQQDTKKYDIVVIGGGHNGLVNAAYLARAGKKVLVLERRPVLGGAAVTEEVFPGFKFSVCSYVVSLLRPEIDRKSTRLNSSHPSISYAVFCLKKKT